MALDLSDKTAYDYTSSTSSYSPPGCQLSSSSLYVYGGDSSGSCSSSKKCICRFTPPSPPSLPPLPPSPPSPPPPSPPPPSPPSPPSPPPMPPGFLQIAAGGYYMIESGSCGSAIISTQSECDAAATALNLSDKTAYDYTSSTSSSYAPGCQLSYSSLYVYGGDSSGSCSSIKKCICRFTPPSPPSLPPLPPSPPSPPPPSLP